MKPSIYITASGHQKLKQELDELWRVIRPEVINALSAAAAEGDRSENAEYIYRKKQLREIDRRIRYLSKRLDVLRVVDELPQDQSAIYFGASVKLRVVEGDAPVERLFRIVGADESDPANGDISIDAPLSRALLKKRVDDEVDFAFGERQTLFVIESIEYKRG